MTFSLHQVYSDAQLEPFVYEGREPGQMHELPNIAVLTPNLAEMALSGQLRPLFEAIAPDDVEMLMSTGVFALEKLMAAWQEHSGVELDAEGKPVGGKSSASSQSSNGTLKPSKRTSDSVASKKSRR
jgi:hypothetical protein